MHSLVEEVWEECNFSIQSDVGAQSRINTARDWIHFLSLSNIMLISFKFAFTAIAALNMNLISLVDTYDLIPASL